MGTVLSCHLVFQRLSIGVVFCFPIGNFLFDSVNILILERFDLSVGIIKLFSDSFQLGFFRVEFVFCNIPAAGKIRDFDTLVNIWLWRCYPLSEKRT